VKMAENNIPILGSYYMSRLNEYEKEIEELEKRLRSVESNQLSPEIRNKIFEETLSKIYEGFGLELKEKPEVISSVKVARNRLESIKRELKERKKLFEEALKYCLEKCEGDPDRAIEKYFSILFSDAKPLPTDFDKEIREIREDLYGGIARHIGLGKAGTILISRCGGEDVNQLRREFASEIGHEIVYQERGLDVSPSVDEFYDAVARLIVDPYPQDIVNEYASVGEKSLNSEPLRDDDLDWDARNYIRRRGVPAHHEGLAIYRRLLRIFGKDLPKIAGKALRNPRIDFSNPNSFYKSVIKEYQGDEK